MGRTGARKPESWWAGRQRHVEIGLRAEGGGGGGRALVGEVHRRETDQREEVQSSRLERKRESKVQHAATIGQPRLPLVSAGTSQTGFHGTLMLRGREKTRLHSQINLGNTRYHQLW